MNQILVTEKLYITPELKRKKKMYKIQFFLSIFLVCLFSSYYIYAEYDRSKSEEVSQEILSGIRVETAVANNDDTTIRISDDVILVAIDENEEETPTINGNSNSTYNSTITVKGVKYTSEAILNIPSLGINYPVLSETSEDLLKISVNKYWGPKPNEVGNYCIVGHNYKNKTMFGKLSGIVNGDIVELTNISNGKTVKYAVYDKYIVEPTDVSCTSQLTNGKKEVTLITCSNYGQQRLVVKAREVK